MSIRLALVAWLLLVASVFADENRVGPAIKKADGVLVHEVTSSYQAKPTLIRVLRPTKVDASVKLPVVYVLPVEAGTENRYGDGLNEIIAHQLHEKHRAMFVAPTFAHLPWYADHPTQATIRQESYFLKIVVPFIDQTYATEGAKGRHLLGFSKSGWGAWSLLLRHSDQFQQASAWDAPLAMSKSGLYGSGDIFGTQENFERYQISKLLTMQAKTVADGKRLHLWGYGNFRREHEQTHTLMETLKITHRYHDGPKRKHDWHSGWVADAVAALLNKE